MSTPNDDDLIRLAQVAGNNIEDTGGFPDWLIFQDRLNTPWKPHEDLAQAIRVAEGMYKRHGKRLRLVGPSWRAKFGKEAEYIKAHRPADAICQAALATLPPA